MIQIIRLSERPSSGASWLVTVFPPTSEAPKLHAYGLSPERVQCSMLFLGNDGVASAILSGQPGQKTGSAGPRPPVAADCQIRAHPPRQLPGRWPRLLIGLDVRRGNSQMPAEKLLVVTGYVFLSDIYAIFHLLSLSASSPPPFA